MTSMACSQDVQRGAAVDRETEAIAETCFSMKKVQSWKDVFSVTASVLKIHLVSSLLKFASGYSYSLVLDFANESIASGKLVLEHAGSVVSDSAKVLKMFALYVSF